MIDDKINSSLKEIERELQNISSARSQVDRTVASYEELKNVTSSYTKSLSAIKDELAGLINTLRVDYAEIISDFKKQQKEIEDKSRTALEAVSDAAETVQKNVNESIKSVNQKLIFSLALNAVLIVIVIVIALHFIK